MQNNQIIANNPFLSWRYDPTLYGKRDLRIDFLRGIAIVSMVFNHLESSSFFSAINRGHIYASAAEGFVFISGLVLGMVTLGRIDKVGFSEAMKKLLERSGKLYLTSFILISVLGLLSIIAPGWTRPAFDFAPGSWWQILLAAATFHLAPPVIDILQLYVLLLLLSPAIFWMLRKGLWLPILAVSWSLWSIQQLHPYALSFHPLDREHPYFALAGWQILYVHGLLAGYYRTKLQELWAKIPKLPLVIGLLLIVIGSITAAHYDIQLGIWPAKFSDRVAWLAWTDRSRVGFLRLINHIGLFPLLYIIVDTFWQPLDKTLGKLLINLGQNSLYIYVVHIPVTVIWFLIPALVNGNPVVATLAQAVTVAFFWFLVKKEVLFNIIPR
ncbi:OpgC domain-containing protein [Nostoc sphaeroides CHAB 2801]|uniref:OpgC domain-containing protein n=1 Tax=Nostoc sphaeroides TaxID=446679 RepID=UPI001E30218B|nr:OpgC domain-containing protein [Nostoc sphaeroides]MCC5633106.1 OpgC domain-containing protein [Nostoc sphaeroides CHAB 2801]